MVAIGIISISLALAAPAVHTAMANRKSQEAVLEVLSIGREARSEAMAYGRAHLLRFTQGSGKGKLEVFRGFNNACNSNDWENITGRAGCGDAASMCRDTFDMENVQGAGSAKLSAVGYEGLDLCFSSSGAMMWRTANGARFSSANIAGANGFVFSVARADEDGQPVGVTRSVIFPMGGFPRIKR